MLHRSYIPALPLGDFVDNFWFFDDYVSPNFKERILPSGTIEMVFNLRDDDCGFMIPYSLSASGDIPARSFLGPIPASF